MEKDKKEYIPPKCVDLSSGFSGQAKGTCVYGSSPGEPCWNGGSPSGFDSDCATGSNPSEAVCATGTSPSAEECLTGGAP